MNSSALKTLFFKEKDRIEPCYHQVSSLLSKGIALYGYGFVGKWAFDFLNSVGADIKIIIDNDKNKQGSFVDNVPVFSSNDIDYANVSCVIIGSRHAAKSIASSLIKLKVPIISIDAFVVLYYTPSHLVMLEKLFGHDEKSLKTLYSILLSMITGDNSYLQNNISFNPFFAEYPFFNVDAEVFLDAGAYVGDSFERFIWSVNGMFKYAYLFEPGKKQFDALSLRLKRLLNEWCITPEKVKCENVMLGEECGKIKFFESNDPIQSQQILPSSLQSFDQSKISLTNKVSLDTYFEKLTLLPTLIKVDIEGSEMEFLNGGQRLISQTMPKMALSVYHYPSDIFLLPEKIAQFAPGYIFSMRHHSCMLMDTVVYCF